MSRFNRSAVVPFSVIALAISGCGGDTSITTTQQAPTIAVSPQSATVPVNGSLTLNAQVGGGSTGTPTWAFTILCGCAASPGTLNTDSGTSITYTAPPTPPIYGPRGDPATQGKVYLTASTVGPFGSANRSVVLTITAPTITTGIDPASATVALNGSVSFVGYAVGGANNGILYAVNGVTGGSATTGYISNSAGSAGTYTAPYVMPMSGNTVTVSVVSQTDPTKSSSALITLH